MINFHGANLKDCLAQAKKKLGSGGRYLIASRTVKGETVLVLEKIEYPTHSKIVIAGKHTNSDMREQERAEGMPHRTVS